MRGCRSTAKASFLLGVVFGIASVVKAQAEDRWWVCTDSREAGIGTPPVLTVKGAGGFEAALVPEADATLIRYLAARAFGRMKQLAVGTKDANRALLRFALPEQLKKVASAELVLEMRPGKHRPRHVVTLDLHAVKSTWQENNTTWTGQPRWDPEAVARFEVPVGGGTVRVDLTKIVRAWLAKPGSNHGLLLKAATPMGFDLGPRIAQSLPWHRSVDEALAAARRDRRLILTCVRPAYQATASDEGEEMLLAAVFCHPEIQALVERRFTLARVGVRPTFFTHGKVRGRDPLRSLGGDATKIKPPALLVSTPDGALLSVLETVGTYDAMLVDRFLRHALAGSGSTTGTGAGAETAAGAGAWSQIAAGRDGSPLTAAELLAAGDLDAAWSMFESQPDRVRDYGRASIARRRGAFDAARRLARPLVAGKDGIAAEAQVELGLIDMRVGAFDAARDWFRQAIQAGSMRSAEASYWLGCVLRRSAEPAAEKEAVQCFERARKLDKVGAWALKATVRLAWPDRIDPAESLRALPGVDVPASTEQAIAEADAPALAHRALRFLVEQQRADGSWPCQVGMYRSAVTALAAKAVDTWVPRVEGPLKGRLSRAAARAEAWVGNHMARVDGRQANSFGSAYILDFLLGRLERTEHKATRALAQRAVAYLEAGQCANGAWSYSHSFGTNWRGGIGSWPRTNKGRVHSVNTGPALIYLATARKQGLEVDGAGIERGVDVLGEMRKAAGVYTYTFPVPETFTRPDQSIARGPVCEQALFLFGASTAEDLEAAMRLYMLHRAALRAPVKIDHSWATPNSYSSYFYFYAHYHAVLALRTLGGEAAKPRLATIRNEILATSELDGTWVDYPQIGKPYGTAIALLILALTERPQ